MVLQLTNPRSACIIPHALIMPNREILFTTLITFMAGLQGFTTSYCARLRNTASNPWYSELNWTEILRAAHNLLTILAHLAWGVPYFRKSYCLFQVMYARSKVRGFRIKTRTARYHLLEIIALDFAIPFNIDCPHLHFCDVIFHVSSKGPGDSNRQNKAWWNSSNFTGNYSGLKALG